MGSPEQIVQQNRVIFYAWTNSLYDQLDSKSILQEHKFCRARLTFGLNALTGRKKSKDDNSLMVGNWNPRNAYEFMKYTVSKGYKIDSYELGKEIRYLVQL